MQNDKFFYQNMEECVKNTLDALQIELIHYVIKSYTVKMSQQSLRKSDNLHFLLNCIKYGIEPYLSNNLFQLIAVRYGSNFG